LRALPFEKAFLMRVGRPIFVAAEQVVTPPMRQTD
jgi:hypothetical protein